VTGWCLDLSKLPNDWLIRGVLPMPPGHIRVIPIAVTTWPDEATRTSNSVCVWIAEATRTSNSACVWIGEATVEGRTYTARSRYGPANQKGPGDTATRET